jgi:hypothetical protein
MTETEPTDPEHLIKLYKADLRTHTRRLSNPQIATLLRTLQDPTADPDTKHAARETLILCCLRLAFALAAREHVRFKLPFEDAISVANLAAIEAVDSITKTFDPTKGGLHAYAKVGPNQQQRSAGTEASETGARSASALAPAGSAFTLRRQNPAGTDFSS